MVAVGVAAFFGGVKYQQSKTPQFPGGFAGGFGRGQRSGSDTQAFTPVMGQIISQDSDSITVKLQDESSKIVLLSSDTSISKMDKGSKSDLKNGQRVRVIGTENSDNSVTAQNIELNPRAFRGAVNSPRQQ